MKGYPLRINWTLGEKRDTKGDTHLRICARAPKIKLDALKKREGEREREREINLSTLRPIVVLQYI